MKANELMIGDWVQIRHPKGLPDANGIQISEIDSSGHSICFFSDIAGGELTLSLDDIQPIPLTPEILEKNGFIKRMSYSNYRWYLDGNNIVTLNIYSERNKTWRISVDTNRNENTIVYVSFVHQLQHALRLCLIEKEIVL